MHETSCAEAIVKRDRTHILEDISISALRENLPEHWVVHEFHRDYGTDVQIELFTPDGCTTGLRVYGQLKSTDNSEGDDTLSLDRDHFEYWASHTDPVLLLRYYAQTRRFKWCWMHQIAWRMKKKASSVGVTSSLKEWHGINTPMAIEQFARLRRKVSTSGISVPARISVRNESAGITGSLALGKQIERRLPASHFNVLAECEEHSHFEVVSEDRRLCISHLGLPGFVAEGDIDDDLEEIADRAVFFIFALSCLHDRKLFARTLSSKCSEALFRAASEDSIGLLIYGLFYSLGLDAAVCSIAEKLSDKEDPLIWGAILTTGLQYSRRFGQQDEWQRMLIRWAEAPPYDEMAAAAAYNAANSLASSGEQKEAIKFYGLAGERDSNYLLLDYYWSELGAAHFEIGNFDAAVDSYQRAFAIAQSPSTEWRLGDALFHNGQYEFALGHISNALKSKTLRDSSYQRLVEIACLELTSRWGLKSQRHRSIDESDHDALMALAPAKSAEDLIAALLDFLRIFAIDSVLAFNAGHFANISGCPDIAWRMYLICALRNRGDGEAWAYAIALAAISGETDVVHDLVKVAYRDVGEELINTLLKALSPIAEILPDAAPAIQQEVIALVRAAELEASNEKPPVLRIHRGNELQVLTLRRN